MPCIRALRFPACLEHGVEYQQRKVFEAILGDPVAFAKGRHASHVVERAFVLGPQTDRIALACGLLEDAATILSLSESPFGSFVVRSVADLSCENTVGPGVSSTQDREASNKQTW